MTAKQALEQPALTREEGEFLTLIYAGGPAPLDPLAIVRMQRLGFITKAIGDPRWFITIAGIRWLEANAKPF